MSASVNLSIHHKVQKYFSVTGSPGWSRKKGRKTVVMWWWWYNIDDIDVKTLCCWLVSGDITTSGTDWPRGQNVGLGLEFNVL